MFPPSDQQSLELHMLTMIQDLAASLLMEFEKWVLRAESTGTILKTPLDSQSSLGSEEVHTLGVPSIFLPVYVDDANGPRLYYLYTTTYFLYFY